MADLSREQPGNRVGGDGLLLSRERPCEPPADRHSPGRSLERRPKLRLGFGRAVEPQQLFAEELVRRLVDGGWTEGVHHAVLEQRSLAKRGKATLVIGAHGYQSVELLTPDKFKLIQPARECCAVRTLSKRCCQARAVARSPRRAAAKAAVKS